MDGVVVLCCQLILWVTIDFQEEISKFVMQRKVLFYLTNINYKLRNKDQVMNMIILDDQKGKLSSMFAFTISGVESLY